MCGLYVEQIQHLTSLTTLLIGNPGNHSIHHLICGGSSNPDLDPNMFQSKSTLYRPMAGQGADQEALQAHDLIRMLIIPEQSRNKVDLGAYSLIE